MKKLILSILLYSFQIYGQNADLEKTINLIIAEITPNNFKYINLVEENLIEKEFDYSIQNYQKREMLSKDSLFPTELITTPQKEKNRISWKTFKLNNCKIYPEKDCERIVTNSKYFIEVKNKLEYDSIIKLNIPNTVIVITKLGEPKAALKRKKAVEKAEKEEQNMEDKSYFSFSVPVFSENKKYFRITIYENKKGNGEGSSKIYKIENDILTEIFEYNRWSTFRSIVN
ncbi:hypothetical protein ACFSJW_08610 [Flavobacterium artemisiae]|uniref:DUF4468 domain-containing protein n=1 Tax=Flavobacterium artemisiae TaxID=2126556 RepID=A0ABW4HFY0_9FLAO